MRKWAVAVALVVVTSIGMVACGGSTDGAAGKAGPGGGQAKAGGPGMGMAQPPMTVELAKVTRASLQAYVEVVGSLVGAATVDVVPRAQGRLQSINVRIGDAVSKGQVLAKVEDQEIREQLRQSDASYEVARATIRQREADLSFAKTNLDRNKSLFDRQLLPRQSLDDAEARYQAAQAQLDLAQAQLAAASSRREELRINLSNTTVNSPVTGFVAKRLVDPGAFVTQNVQLLSVVDISIVRLVVNLVERDLRKVSVGAGAAVTVDAYPGETFSGRVARVAPVLDPATRTAEMEVEIPNPTGRLKPGMYARVRLISANKDDALVIPKSAIVTSQGQRGVFLVQKGQAVFRGVEFGLEEPDRIEVTDGLNEGDEVVTTGATGLRDGAKVLLAGAGRGPGGGRGPAGQAGPGGPRGGAPAAGAGTPKSASAR
ncbi:RND transporter [Luteitalea sp. TBR-22]|uniref:efflux RND transporter periplasmic adaptor subunit n=1 Tax=Luteitalea sp. TBR-22 TaxID=2802971 RepID=UPI001AF9393B|nr:efflux RND transporter periplasmic adaptor subunit [Luteitalea sp. TBR-22]BCS33942.1 RND transporter [Luteitalea sp. TBR-22]